MKWAGDKQEMEEILRECVEDLKMDIVKVKSESRTAHSGTSTLNH